MITLDNGIRLNIEVGLDWRGPGHMDFSAELPCRVCRRPTYQRDDEQQPCDRACVEHEYAEEVIRIVRSAWANR